MLPVVHFLHVACGIVWAGGTVLWVFAIVPALLRLEPMEMRHAYEAMKPYAGPLLGISGVLIILTGLARLYVGGAVTTLSDLGGSYAIHALSALAILLVLAGVESRFRSSIDSLLESDGDPRPALRSIHRRVALLTALGLVTIVILMTMLGLGYY